MRVKKLTPFGRKICSTILCILVLAIVGVGAWKFGIIDNIKNSLTKEDTPKTTAQVSHKKAKTDTIKTTAATPATSSVTKNTTSSNDKTLNLSLDEWIGWKPILDANGGLETKSGSIFDKLGLKVSIKVINDGSQSSNALIKGDLNAAGYTVNRFSFLYPKFKASNVPVKMAYITNSSTGGDGIIARKGINRIEDLIGKKVGVPRFSEAQTLVEWLMSKSSLSDTQIKAIRKSFVYFDTPDDAAKAFFSGKLDAAATWQPYLSQAQETSDAHILFSTKSATNIILDGIVFRQDFINEHSNEVSKFVQGAIEGIKDYTTDMTPIKNSFPTFATSTDKDIKDMTSTATLTDCSTNNSLLSGLAQNLFYDMSNIWKNIGEKAIPEDKDKVFDNTFIKALMPKLPEQTTTKVTFTEAERQQAQTQNNNTALLTQRLTIHFNTGEASISDDSYAALNDFANTAKILNGTIIQIEGNTDNVGDVTTNKTLSEKRAKSVATYLKYQGVDPMRFIIVGNGPSKPIAPNTTNAGKAQNRRTDIYFKVVK